MDLISEDGKYNYVAYLLSDNNTMSLQVAKYKGIDTYNLIKSEDYGNCCIIKATKNILSRLELENRTFTKITSIDRKEIKMIDTIALREAIINAIVHNDYTIEYTPKFELFDDRLEISSSGGLPERFTVEDFLGGFSAPKNKELMRIFKDVGLVEQFGTGIRRILKVYDPGIYEFYPNFIRVKFSYRKNPFCLSTEVENLNEIQKEIVEEIRENYKITQIDLAEKLKVSKRTIIRHMEGLSTKGILKRHGNNRTGYWEIIE